MSNSITTVTVAATSFDLTTVARLKLSRDIRVSTNDAYLAMRISQVSADVSDFCNRVFARQTYQQIFRGWTTGLNTDLWYGTEANPFGIAETQSAVRLRNYPLSSITSIVEDGVTLVEGTDFEVNAANGLIYRLDGNGGRQRWFYSLLTIVYVAGWTLPSDTLNATWTLPANVESIVMRAVGDSYISRGRDPDLYRVSVEGVGMREYQRNVNGTALTINSPALPQYIKESLSNAGYVVPIVR